MPRATGHLTPITTDLHLLYSQGSEKNLRLTSDPGQETRVLNQFWSRSRLRWDLMSVFCFIAPQMDPLGPDEGEVQCL